MTTIQHRWYHFKTLIQHLLNAGNTFGFGIHSPNIFYLVTEVINNKYPYYAWKQIEQTPPTLSKRQTHINRILFALANHLTHHLRQPYDILALSDNTNLIEAYLASPNANNRILTLTTHEPHHANTTFPNIIHLTLTPENINNCTDNTNTEWGMLILNLQNNLFNNWQKCKKHLNNNSLAVMLNIHDNETMLQDWQNIQNDTSVTATLDYYYFGIALFDTHFLKKHYKIILLD